MEFGVHGISEHPEGVRVVGRCLVGPIKVRSVFRRMRRYIDPGNSAEVELALEVIQIHAYGRTLEAVDEGLTAALVLKGLVPDALGDGWALVG